MNVYKNCLYEIQNLSLSIRSAAISITQIKLRHFQVSVFKRKEINNFSEAVKA